MIDCRAGAPPAVLQRLDDQALSQVHPQRQRLQDRVIAVAIDDHARQSIALAPDDAAKSRIDPAPLPILHGLRDPALEKIEIEVLPPPRESPGHDLRFAVVNRAADQVISSVFQRNDVAIRRISERLQNFAGKHPIVPVQNSRARFDDEAGHGKRG